MEAMIAVTYDCQCSCQHCDTAKYKKKNETELNTDEFMILIDQMTDIGVGGIFFFGGEPLLRRDLLTLVRYSKQKRLETRFDTNGYLLNSRLAKQLKEAGLDMVGVSIDSCDPKEHDGWRGINGIFDRAIRAIKYSLYEGIECYISTFATNENVNNGDLEGIISLGRRLRVQQVRITFPILTGNWLGADEMRLNLDAEEKLKSLARSKFVSLVHYWPNDPRFYCDAAEGRLIYVSCYGDVQPCFAIPLSFGNVRQEPLKVIVTRMYRSQIFERDLNNCPMYDRGFREKYIPGSVSREELPLSYQEIIGPLRF
jgi:MoaA/NifB/PqqE/SkfB family radical SAM enzyme